MEVKAFLRHLRMAPRKVRLIVDTIRGLKVKEAETRLSFTNRDAARPVLKLLQSAVANATHNFKLDPETLFVKTIAADGGATLKRFRPRAMGRAAPIRKRTTHITLILSDEPTPVKGKKGVKVAAPVASEAPKKAESKKKAPAKKPANAQA